MAIRGSSRVSKSDPVRARQGACPALSAPQWETARSRRPAPASPSHSSAQQTGPGAVACGPLQFRAPKQQDVPRGSGMPHPSYQLAMRERPCTHSRGWAGLHLCSGENRPAPSRDAPREPTPPPPCLVGGRAASPQRASVPGEGLINHPDTFCCKRNILCVKHFLQDFLFYRGSVRAGRHVGTVGGLYPWSGRAPGEG